MTPVQQHHDGQGTKQQNTCRIERYSDIKRRRQGCVRGPWNYRTQCVRVAIVLLFAFRSKMRRASPATSLSRGPHLPLSVLYPFC